MNLSELKPGAPKNFQREREGVQVQEMEKPQEEVIKDKMHAQAAV